MKLLFVLSSAILMVVSRFGVQAAEPADLEMVQSVSIPDLRGVCGVTISGDGKFLYTAAYQADAICIFTRDLQTGQLTLADTLQGEIAVQSICLRLSTDEKYAAVAQNAARKVSVFKRDPVTGKLTKAAEFSGATVGAGGLRSPIEAKLSLDNRFLYVATSPGVAVFSFNGDQLEFVQSEEADGKLNGVRGFAFSPDGHWLYAAAFESGTLGGFRRDEATGKLEQTQLLSNGENGVNALRGAFRVALSADGKNVYVSAGRFIGDQAISVFSVESDGSLKVLQEFVNGTDDFTEFEGGNEINVSPDGKSVCAVTSVSDRLFRFARDPKTGKLTFITSQQEGTFAQPGAAGLCFSPDGKFVYVADEGEGAVEAYKLKEEGRRKKSGALRKRRRVGKEGERRRAVPALFMSLCHTVEGRLAFGPFFLLPSAFLL
ncbi:MAG TPA: beta-propeller fold lactonase family protein [Chthoniobacteraceae bacterium]